MEFDVWSDGDGSLIATKAASRFVDDSHAPYGYARHMQRVTAENKRAAVAAYRRAAK